jgi:cation-transporting ATPase 13A1
MTNTIPSPYITTTAQTADPKVIGYSFNYQRDNYLYDHSTSAFAKLPYPSSARPPLSSFAKHSGLSDNLMGPLLEMFGKNEFDIPIPTFTALFGEHATAPFFVFQIFCVALWFLDEYWYYSLFTLFMLVVFECTVVFQVRTHLDLHNVYIHAESILT